MLLKIMIVGFTMNFLFGLVGSFFPANSYQQLISWQVGDSVAIMACILASRQVGVRGQNIAAAGYTLLGIAYGVSFASSSIQSVNEEKMATIILPLVPALFLVSFCKFFPSWLRYGSLLVYVPFFFMYTNIIQGTYSPDNLSNILAYSGIQILGVFWSVYIYKEHQKAQPQ